MRGAFISRGGARPSAPGARLMSKRPLRELGAVFAGHRPDKITVSVRRQRDSAATKKEIEENRGI